MKKTLPYLLASVLATFGLLTLFLSSSVVFDLFGIRAKEGNYVLFVVWANFISSLLYLVAVYGIIKNKKWTVPVLGASAIILILASTGLIFHIKAGGLYEVKTIGAIIFRTLLTFVFLILSYFLIYRSPKHEN